ADAAGCRRGRGRALRGRRRPRAARGGRGLGAARDARAGPAGGRPAGRPLPRRARRHRGPPTGARPDGGRRV
ncbi:MAG: hypothetical protein AVDCRST_MAG48-2039, partial [uncultured Friedmanniella sp.]